MYDIACHQIFVDNELHSAFKAAKKIYYLTFWSYVTVSRKIYIFFVWCYIYKSIVGFSFMPHLH